MHHSLSTHSHRHSVLTRLTGFHINFKRGRKAPQPDREENLYASP
nr:MAG TPA: hypothetical protein [Caudoviricetes sp.]